MVRCNFSPIAVDQSKKSGFDIDWLSFVVKLSDEQVNNCKFIKKECGEVPFDIFEDYTNPLIDDVLSILGCSRDDFFLQAGGMQRYSEFYDFKGSGSFIYLTCHNRADMGIYFSMSSSFIHSVSESTIFNLLSFIRDAEHIRPSRVDILFDDFENNSFNYQDFEDAAFRYCLGKPTWLDTRCSTLHTFSEGVSEVFYNGVRSDFRDLNITLGARSSPTYCRIYNKMIERISKDRKHYDGSDPVQLPIYFWKRIELELKHDHAVEFFNNFHSMSDIPCLFCLYFERLVRVLDKDSEEKKLAFWWENFVQLSKNIYFVQFRKSLLPKSFESARDQMLKQYKSLLCVLLEQDDGILWLKQNVPLGLDNYTANRYRASLSSG